VIDVNIIVTCYNKEEYLHGLLETFSLYKHIKPHIVICYSGDMDSFPCHIRVANRGHQLGDIDLTLLGYNYLKSNGFSKFIKISIDSWLLNDLKLVDIFKFMEAQQSAYAGNLWFSEQSPSLATDIIIADTRFGNIFESFAWDNHFFETSLFSTIIKNQFHALILKHRVPVVPDFRFCCPGLDWIMDHDLKKNLEYLWAYKNSMSQEV